MTINIPFCVFKDRISLPGVWFPTISRFVSLKTGFLCRGSGSLHIVKLPVQVKNENIVNQSVDQNLQL